MTKPAVYKNSERFKIEFRITSAPIMASDLSFTPVKAVVTDFGDRSNITVSGRTLFSHRRRVEERSVMFNISGYPDKANPPDWLQELLDQVIKKFSKDSS